MSSAAQKAVVTIPLAPCALVSLAALLFLGRLGTPCLTHTVQSSQTSLPYGGTWLICLSSVCLCLNVTFSRHATHAS